MGDAHSSLTSASKFNIEPNGGVFDVSPENGRASPNVKTPSVNSFTWHQGDQRVEFLTENIKYNLRDKVLIFDPNSTKTNMEEKQNASKKTTRRTKACEQGMANRKSETEILLVVVHDAQQWPI